MDWSIISTSNTIRMAIRFLLRPKVKVFCLVKLLSVFVKNGNYTHTKLSFRIQLPLKYTLKKAIR